MVLCCCFKNAFNPVYVPICIDRFGTTDAEKKQKMSVAYTFIKVDKTEKRTQWVKAAILEGNLLNKDVLNIAQ